MVRAFILKCELLGDSHIFTFLHLSLNNINQLFFIAVIAVPTYDIRWINSKLCASELSQGILEVMNESLDSQSII